MRSLIEEIETIIDKTRGTWGIVLKDLITKNIWTINPHKQFYSASIVKLPIMATLFQAYEQGKISSLEKSLLIKESDLVGGAGVLQHMTPNIKLPLYDIMTLMIIQSDNTATNMIIDLIGIEEIQNLMKDIGMENSTCYNKLMISSPSSSGPNLTTAMDNALFLEKLYKGEIVSKTASKRMLDIMKKQQIRNCLPNYLPYQQIRSDEYMPRWELAHKTGWVPGLRHDVGIFYVERKPFIVSVFSKDVEDVQSEQAIAKIGEAVYTYLG